MQVLVSRRLFVGAEGWEEEEEEVSVVLLGGHGVWEIVCGGCGGN